MKRTLAVIVFSALTCAFAGNAWAQDVKDTDRLGMALDYFKSGKYHESLLLFEKLDKTYKLNPRFHAYMGLCYYHEWDYEQALKQFGASLPLLNGLSPHELSVYYYAQAESQFALLRYTEALDSYERVLTLCYDNEKADCLYRIGFCHMEQKEWANAEEAFTSALAHYEKYLNDAAHAPRIRQIQNMIKGCKAKAAEEQHYDSTQIGNDK